MIVTSATSAFKDNMDLDEEDNEETTVKSHPVVGDANGLTQPFEDIQPKNPSSYSTAKNKLSVQDNNNNFNEQQPGDEWEEFDDIKSNYDRLRLKFQRSTHEDNENEEDYSDDENTHRTNFDENYNGFDEVDGERKPRNNKQNEQQKDKPAWNLDQVKQAATINDQPAEKIDEQPSAPVPVKSATTGAYRPPQLRGNSAVTVVSSGTQQRGSKKEKPNLASTEEFPTLGAAVHKK